MIANFSSGGPTPVSLRMKPDVTAPGDFVLSSVPRVRAVGVLERDEHGLAARRRRGRAPQADPSGVDGRPDQVGPGLDRVPVYTGSNHATETTATREGGGFIKLPRANDPLIFASPTGLSFGLLRGGAAAAKTVTLSDAGGGAGSWHISVEQQQGRRAA